MQEFLLRERQSVISDRLRTDGRVLAAALAVEFGVSEDTVRRDLREMAAAGLCERVYGGALPLSPAGGSLKQRMAFAVDRKQALARAAVTEIAAGSTVFFDAGSTNVAIANALPDELELTAVTNAPAIAAALVERPAINVILIGGMVDRRTGGSLGAKAMRDMEQLAPDLCILGACGVDLKAGVTAFEFEDAEFKRFAVARSRSVLVAVTSEKLGAVAPHRITPISENACLVVEHDADPGLLALFRDCGCRTVIADASA